MTQAQLDELLAIRTPADIRSFEMGEQFEDDHQLCADVEINGITVSFYWFDSLGFLEYLMESPSAFKKFLICLPNAIMTTSDEEGSSTVEDNDGRLMEEIDLRNKGEWTVAA